MVTFLKIVLIVLVVAVVGVGGAVLVSPTVTLQNRCGRPLDLPVDVPLVGRQLKEGDTQVKAPPGDYQLTASGSTLRVVGPLGIDVTVEASTGNVAITKDGVPVSLGSSQTISLGFGSNAVATLCSNP